MWKLPQNQSFCHLSALATSARNASEKLLYIVGDLQISQRVENVEGWNLQHWVGLRQSTKYFILAALSSTHRARRSQCLSECVSAAAFCNAKVVTHRAALISAHLVPTHRREPHALWTAAVRLFLLLMLHPPPQTMLHPPPQTMKWAWTHQASCARQDSLPLKLQCFSAGSRVWRHLRRPNY